MLAEITWNINKRHSFILGLSHWETSAQNAIETSMPVQNKLQNTKVKRTATLKDHEGKVSTIDVDPTVKNLENVKVGDQVVYQFTKAIAFDISKVE